MTPYPNNRCVLGSAIIGGVILFGAYVGFAQMPAPATNLPAAKDALQYLTETNNGSKIYDA
jgi:hypothetical protein